MIFLQHFTKISALSLILVASLSPLTAATEVRPKNSPKKTGKSSTTTSKKVENAQEGKVAMLADDPLSIMPIEEVIQEKAISDLLVNNLTADYISVNLAKITEGLIVKKEIQELSAKLGIKVENNEYLDFYREVANWLGTRYRLGSMSKSGVDCSGFTNIIYNTVFNQKLPRVSTAIAQNVKVSLKKDELLPGDLVFFSTFKRKYINHVGIYIGDGHFIHASIKRGVIVSSLVEGYYSTAWRKGGRMN